MIYSKTEYILLEISDLDRYQQMFKRSPRHDLTDVTVTVAEEEDFDRLAQTIDKFKGTARLADRRRHGDICVVAYRDEALAYFTWAALEEYRFPGYDYPGAKTMYLGDDEAYTYDSYTVPEFRRKGISPEGYRFKVVCLRKLGIKTVYSDINRANEKAVSFVQKYIQLGVEKSLGVVSITNVLGWKSYSFHGETQQDSQKIAKLFNLHS